MYDLATWCCIEKEYEKILTQESQAKISFSLYTRPSHNEASDLIAFHQRTSKGPRDALMCVSVSALTACKNKRHTF